MIVTCELLKINRNVIQYKDIAIDKLDKNSDLFKKIKPYIKDSSLFETVGSWSYVGRAYRFDCANFIYSWFYQNVQNGEDSTLQYEVNKEQLKSLLTASEDMLQCESQMDENNLDELKKTISIIKKALKTDFEQYQILYSSSVWQY